MCEHAYKDAVLRMRELYRLEKANVNSEPKNIKNLTDQECTIALARIPALKAIGKIKISDENREIQKCDEQYWIDKYGVPYDPNDLRDEEEEQEPEDWEKEYKHQYTERELQLIKKYFALAEDVEEGQKGKITNNNLCNFEYLGDRKAIYKNQFGTMLAENVVTTKNYVCMK